MINVWIGLSSKLKQQSEDIRDQKAIVGKKEVTDKEAVLFGKVVDAYAPKMRPATVDAVAMTMESIYVDTVDDVQELVKSGAVVLGAWDWSGARVEGIEIHKDIGKFMPSRFETDDKGDTTEIVDETPRDITLVWGQGERQFA